jgi:hypothetical protein
MSAGGKDKAAYRAAGPGKMGFKKGAYGSAKGVRAKAANLSDAQLKRAGGAKAAAKRTVDIGSTSRVAGKTLGPGGKPLTGSVKLANGQMAVYKAGKRVINVKRSKDGNPPPPKPKTPPLDMRKNAPGTRSDVKASASRIAAYNTAKSKTMDVEAKRVAAKRRPAAGKSTTSTKPKKSVAFGEDTALMYGLNTMKRLGF